jgi:sec-independent protein translocase protein TatC
MGVLFGYFVISPFAVSFLSSYTVSADISNTTTLTSYVNYMTMFTIPTGIIFELPIVIYFLSKVGIVTPQFLRTYRRHAIVIIFVAASIITPPDVVTQFLIATPLIILYEISIFISKRQQKRKD